MELALRISAARLRKRLKKCIWTLCPDIATRPGCLGSSTVPFITDELRTQTLELTKRTKYMVKRVLGSPVF